MERQEQIRLSSWLTVSVFVVLIALLRLHTYDETLERDLVIHATIANEWLQGRALYSDLWNHKPPASFLIHALFIQAVGFGPPAIYAINVFFNGLTAITIFVLAWQLTRSNSVAIAIAGLWALVSFDLPLQANQPNSEALVNPFLLSAIAIWLAIVNNQLRVAWALAAGLLLFLASFFKQQYLLIPGAVFAGLGAYVCAFDRTSVRRYALAFGIALLAMFAGWAIAFAVFWRSGSLDDFIFAAFRFNVSYGGSLYWNLRASVHGKLFPSFASTLYPFVLGAAGALIALALARQWKPLVILASWMAGTHLAVALPGKFFPHYYQLWAPVLLLASGLFMHQLALLGRGLVRPLFIGALGIVALLATVGRVVEYLSLTSEQWCLRKYPDEHFVEARGVGESLRPFLHEREWVFYLGNYPSLFFYGNLRPVSGKLYATWLRAPRELASPLRADTIRRFQHGGFDVAVINADPAKLGVLEIWRGLEQDFVRVSDCFPHHDIWVRRSSPYLRILQRDLAPFSGEWMRRFNAPSECMPES